MFAVEQLVFEENISHGNTLKMQIKAIMEYLFLIICFDQIALTLVAIALARSAVDKGKPIKLF